MADKNYNKQKPEVEIIEQRAQPHDDASEMAVLGTLIQYNELYNENSDLLNGDLFYNPFLKSVFIAIEGVLRSGREANINSLCVYAQANVLPETFSREDLVQIFQYSSPQTFRQDLARVVEFSKRRALWKSMMVAADKVLDLTHELNATIGNLSAVLEDAQQDHADDGVFSFSEAVTSLRAIVEENTKGKPTALKTGFKIFDNYFLLRPTTLTILAAFTSVGKTALAMNITHAIAAQGIPCAYFSLEMGKEDLASRVISGDAQVSSSSIINRKLGEYEREMFDKAAAKDSNLPIYIDERTAASFSKTIRSTRALVKRYGVKFVVIDYLQIYNQEGENNELALGAMVRAAKNVAMELKIAIVLLSQLNRSADHPSIKMLRGSGQIEESADNIVLIDRPEAYPDNNVSKYEGEFKDSSIHGTAKLILAKGRGVGTGSELVGFEPRYTQFYELNFNSPNEQNSEIPF